MWPIKQRVNKHSRSYCGQFISRIQTVRMLLYGSLFSINSSGLSKLGQSWFMLWLRYFREEFEQVGRYTRVSLLGIAHTHTLSMVHRWGCLLWTCKRVSCSSFPSKESACSMQCCVRERQFRKFFVKWLWCLRENRKFSMKNRWSPKYSDLTKVVDNSPYVTYSSPQIPSILLKSLLFCHNIYDLVGTDMKLDKWSFASILIHSADPQPRQVVIIR